MPAPAPMRPTWGAVCPTCGMTHQVPKAVEGHEEKQMEGKEPVKKPVPSADVVPVPKEEKK